MQDPGVPVDDGSEGREVGHGRRPLEGLDQPLGREDDLFAGDDLALQHAIVQAERQAATVEVIAEATLALPEPAVGRCGLKDRDLAVLGAVSLVVEATGEVHDREPGPEVVLVGTEPNEGRRDRTHRKRADSSRDETARHRAELTGRRRQSLSLIPTVIRHIGADDGTAGEATEERRGHGLLRIP